MSEWKVMYSLYLIKENGVYCLNSQQDIPYSAAKMCYCAPTISIQNRRGYTVHMPTSRRSYNYVFKASYTPSK